MTTIENNVRLTFRGAISKAPTRHGIVRTKVVCTLGPATRSKQTIAALLSAGMNVVRLNFSHGTHDYHAGTISMLREVLAETKRTCAVMLDTRGPEIRTGLLSEELHGEVALKAGQTFTLYSNLSDPQRQRGNAKGVFQSCRDLSSILSPGAQVLIDDGLIALTVEEVCADQVHCRVMNDGVLGERKGINLPGATYNLPALTEQDMQDILFGIAQGVDFVAASFIRKRIDVEQIRSFLKEHGGSAIQIISKIENQEGLENFDDILEASDGIMVARGDLGVEVRLELVASAQKHMISKCNVAGKPVITATQMLDSMIKNPRPTRAEVSDVANAVFDGTDCVMLSGETAKGLYPVQAVQTMVNICMEAERALDHAAVFQAIRNFARSHELSVTEAIASSAVKAAYDLKATMILCLSETGRTARLVCKYRPSCPCLVLTSNELTARQCLLSRDCFPVVVGSMIGTESLIARGLQTARASGIVATGDLVILISGMREGVSGSTNLLRIITVEA
ncbi:pyruvate kinase I [Cyanidioschyzon merolae strain 10D]|jgi:pyruvate kinase|uniref:Pyruvate kinase n=1 Tax=Cyanidioschyzon merolae (strain NIES-3377 / 10D) TaxID=280699 RepID=M1VK88_CYAM1|nr:pyruvate kinase I [Cyanidioschyzon merolae strain 10D]BAM81868.1 pyruvate kinase I [Cyanidioschyzon merolae strain 10D]|eukprot:XP_005537904.1 pyruvate kinase I [Cyanidioschyzon merolae strain 10D]